MYPLRLVWRLAAIAWAGQIYWMSASSEFSSDNTRSQLADFLQKVFGLHPGESVVWLMHLLLRKGAHVAEYSVLAFLVFHALDGLRFSHDRKHRALLCVALTGAYCLTDELHQWFVPGRGASLVDCAIDLVGIALTIAMLYTFPLGNARRTGGPLRVG